MWALVWAMVVVLQHSPTPAALRPLLVCFLALLDLLPLLALAAAAICLLCWRTMRAEAAAEERAVRERQQLEAQVLGHTRLDTPLVALQREAALSLQRSEASYMGWLSAGFSVIFCVLALFAAEASRALLALWNTSHMMDAMAVLAAQEGVDPMDFQTPSGLRALVFYTLTHIIVMLAMVMGVRAVQQTFDAEDALALALGELTPSQQLALRQASSILSLAATPLTLERAGEGRYRRTHEDTQGRLHGIQIITSPLHDIAAVAAALEKRAKQRAKYAPQLVARGVVLVPKAGTEHALAFYKSTPTSVLPMQQGPRQRQTGLRTLTRRVGGRRTTLRDMHAQMALGEEGSMELPSLSPQPSPQTQKANAPPQEIVPPVQVLRSPSGAVLQSPVSWRMRAARAQSSSGTHDEDSACRSSADSALAPQSMLSPLQQAFTSPTFAVGSGATSSRRYQPRSRSERVDDQKKPPIFFVSPSRAESDGGESYPSRGRQRNDSVIRNVGSFDFISETEPDVTGEEASSSAKVSKNDDGWRDLSLLSPVSLSLPIGLDTRMRAVPQSQAPVSHLTPLSDLPHPSSRAADSRDTAAGSGRSTPIGTSAPLSGKELLDAALATSRALSPRNLLLSGRVNWKNRRATAAMQGSDIVPSAFSHALLSPHSNAVLSPSSPPIGEAAPSGFPVPSDSAHGIDAELRSPVGFAPRSRAPARMEVSSPSAHMGSGVELMARTGRQNAGAPFRGSVPKVPRAAIANDGGYLSSLRPEFLRAQRLPCPEPPLLPLSSPDTGSGSRPAVGERRKMLLCFTCYDAPADGIFMECGHSGTCFECAKTIARGRITMPADGSGQPIMTGGTGVCPIVSNISAKMDLRLDNLGSCFNHGVRVSPCLSLPCAVPLARPNRIAGRAGDQDCRRTHGRSGVATLSVAGARSDPC
jgi:hypothetical protein